MPYTLNLTYNQLHAILDAITQHEVKIDLGETDPTRVYEGVYPDGYPLRVPAEYRAILGDAGETINAAIGASVEDATITLTIEN